MNISSLFSLEGKTALVTGGSKGIGAMIAKGLIDAGSQVYISSRNEEECIQAAKEMSNDKLKCLALPGDVSSLAGINELVEKYSKNEASLDILVNNAGIVWQDSIDNFPEDGWDQVLNTNLKSVFFLTQALLPFLKIPATLEDPSRIINIGSIDGINKNTFKHYSYSASKSAVHHLTKVLAAELVDKYINVNVIAPGPFPSNMLGKAVSFDYGELEKRNPRGRVGTPEDIAGLAIYLSSRAGAFTVGEVITCDGGLVAVAGHDLTS